MCCLRLGSGRLSCPTIGCALLQARELCDETFSLPNGAHDQQRRLGGPWRTHRDPQPAHRSPTSGRHISLRRRRPPACRRPRGASGDRGLAHRARERSDAETRTASRRFTTLATHSVRSSDSFRHSSKRMWTCSTRCSPMAPMQTPESRRARPARQRCRLIRISARLRSALRPADARTAWWTDCSSAEQSPTEAHHRTIRRSSARCGTGATKSFACCWRTARASSISPSAAGLRSSV